MYLEFETIPINCIWADPEEFIEQVKVVRNQSNTASRWTYTKRALDLKAIFFPAPPSGGRQLGRFALWRPKSVSIGSAMLSNYEDGMIQLLRHINRAFHTQYMSARIAKNHLKYGFCGFEFADTFGQRRVVHVIKDPRWEFFQSGKPLPFENVNSYHSKSVPTRMTPELLSDYLKLLGWDLRNEMFWHAQDSWLATQDPSLGFSRLI